MDGHEIWGGGQRRKVAAPEANTNVAFPDPVWRQLQNGSSVDMDICEAKAMAQFNYLLYPRTQPQEIVPVQIYKLTSDQTLKCWLTYNRGGGGARLAIPAASRSRALGDLL